jgi:cytochrome c oxidase assembly protein subunit 15
VIVILVLAWRLRRRTAERTELAEWVSAWIVVALLQGAIGYIQYFNGVPALLVGLHVLGASTLWAVSVALVLRTLPVRRAATADDGATVAATAVAATP